MTPGEHFRIFGEIRGLNKDEIIKETKEKLDAVKLSEHKHAYVKSFSGGMKRRLSLALSSLGNPSFIFLDEPTVIFFLSIFIHVFILYFYCIKIRLEWILRFEKKFGIWFKIWK